MVVNLSNMAADKNDDHHGTTTQRTTGDYWQLLRVREVWVFIGQLPHDFHEAANEWNLLAAYPAEIPDLDFEAAYLRAQCGKEE